MEKLSFDNIKKIYPNEWVVIGNPIIENNYISVKEGIVINHNTDKKKLVTESIQLVKTYHDFVIRYTGELPKIGKWLSLRSI